MTDAFISEIYPSVQGEGPFTGEPQIFVRLAGCPLRCNYCDTPGSLSVQGHPLLSVASVMKTIRQLHRAHKIQTVSVTGGEPLVQAGFLKELFSELQKNKLKIYLETAGIHPNNLKRVIRYCDVIAMDVKLPSAVKHSYWSQHREFLKVAGKKAFVKIVIEAQSSLGELKQAVRMLASSKLKPLLVLQPATPLASHGKAPSWEKISAMYQLASRSLPRVLVMPQQHKSWRIR